MSARFTVQVDADQFDSLARPTQPVPGVAELIWNSLDAEAEIVTVSIARTELDAVDYVVVTDDGHGMTNDDAIRDFKKLGGSWKNVGTGGRRLSKNGRRSLDGSQGEGAFVRSPSVGWPNGPRSSRARARWSEQSSPGRWIAPSLWSAIPRS